ncbi:putative membrane protein [Cronobacter condimenti 1330]|uniref:Nickel/cobalt efflux system n=1 Tax=Cronobacter condimenti 1330 TaxID=1073999 RepID=K7ZXB1_9ENTR|nr:nickel/cobalt transporter [Cronobacter condimenti]ALB63702.1 nickel transporter [Cronobacter condimenti 1330]CCJ70883.1 putative membrane protein [Cronobacter condimenti 1330]
MSVISPPIATRRWRHFWPLALFILLTIVGGCWLWLAWPQVLMKSLVWQREINREMSALLQQVAQNPTRAGGSLLLFSFIYGVLHALGPGHGKVVIATWLATHPSRLKTSLSLVFASSLLQGLVAVVLVTVVLTVLALPARQMHLSGYWLEKGSYLLVGGLGLMLCWRAGKTLRGLLRRPMFTGFTPHHTHSATCGCGHQHVPTQAQLERGEDWRARLMVVFSMGMRPCSGALMVLLFSKVIGVYGWGIASALAMAAGTSLTISGIALFVHSFRRLAARYGGQTSAPLWRRTGGATLALAGGVVLVVAALVMWLSAAPTAQGLQPF